MESKNIEELVNKALDLWHGQGFADATIHSRRKVLKALIRRHHECGFIEYNDEIVSEYIEEQKVSYGEGRLKRDSYTFKAKTALQLRELVTSGSIECGHTDRECGMTEYYEDIVAQMFSFPEWDEKHSHNIRRYAMPFFKWLSANGINSLDGINETIIRQYMLDASKRLKLNSVNHINYGLKCLFYFLYASGLIDDDFTYVFALPLPKEHKVRKPISHEEIAGILGSIDQSSPQGKRDYAMILIGTVTGLRSADILALKFENIDWINGEIRISQVKTGKALALPLTADIGEALQAYIINGRPESNSEYIFLRLCAPYTRLTASALYNIFNAYRFSLGLPRCGFHDLRRALGTSLVTTGTSVTTVAQVLGHRNIESTKQYISLDTEHLRDIGLDLRGFMPEEEGDDNGV